MQAISNKLIFRSSGTLVSWMLVSRSSRMLVSRSSRMLVVVLSAHAGAATLGVPNIVIPNTTIPSMINHVAGNDAANAKLLQQQLVTFSAQVRGKLIQQNYFQLVDVDNNLVQYYLISESGSDEVQPSESIAYLSKTNKLPLYMLIGQLSALSAGSEIQPLGASNNSSVIYSLDLAVDYKLVRTRDHRLIATFTAAGHAGDAKLMSSNLPAVSHNTPFLLQQVGNNLAGEVVTQLNNQIESGKLAAHDPESAAPSR